LLPNSLPTM